MRADQYPTQADVARWIGIRFPTKTAIEWRALKLAEEAGEVAGAVQKIPEGRKTRNDLGMELAQTVICAMAVAEAAGLDLDEWVEAVWATDGIPVLARTEPVL